LATYVLVHGGGHGGWCYQPVSRLLRAQGHDVYAPSLTGLGEREHLFRCDVDLDCHITDIVKLLHFEDLRDVILVGHSYGGMVITGVADRTADRVGHLVYLDAAIPSDGQSLVEIAGPLMALARSDSRIVDGVEMCMYIDNRTIPYYGVHDPDQVEWMTARLTPHPWKCFEQPLRLTDEDALAKIPQSYICTTMFMDVRPVDTLRQKANGRLWELDTGHDLMITAPEWVAEKLMLVASLADESIHEA
jgi:pimeloyl-ACP methyl ester carboxylesterase